MGYETQTDHFPVSVLSKEKRVGEIWSKSLDIAVEWLKNLSIALPSLKLT